MELTGPMRRFRADTVFQGNLEAYNNTELAVNMLGYGVASLGTGYTQKKTPKYINHIEGNSYNINKFYKIHPAIYTHEGKTKCDR